MEITLDSLVFRRYGPVVLNATILYTWLVMALLTLVSWLVSRRLSSGPEISRAQNLLEVVVSGVRDQIRQISQEAPDRYLPFIGTLYLFIAVSNLLAFVPGYHPPTGSLSTTAALAGCVFMAVPLYGIAQRGLGGFLGHYFRPSVFMLPFHIISEISRTLALAVRLFGNVMSGVLLGGILLSIAPLFFPIILQALELLIGQIQAFIFAVLATLYIASASQAHEEGRQRVLADSTEEIKPNQQEGMNA
ncbi:MAG: F0F1 ATP synthase subunit A [Deltaproteobacteria bacterium]|nr:MAG: F0F1 ATP synthase subunit A [Deltaproteobacteria bacterium]